MYPRLLGKRLAVWTPLVLLAAAAGGCGEPAAQVQGRVTHNGSPVAGADVMLSAVEDPRRQFFGATGEDGTIHVSYGEQSGAPPGTYTIRVTHVMLRDGSPLPPGEEGEALRNSPRAVERTFLFERDLSTGANPLDLKLEEGRLDSVAAP